MNRIQVSYDYNEGLRSALVLPTPTVPSCATILRTKETFDTRQEGEEFNRRTGNDSQEKEKDCTHLANSSSFASSSVSEPSGLPFGVEPLLLNVTLLLSSLSALAYFEVDCCENSTNEHCDCVARYAGEICRDEHSRFRHI